MKKIGRREFIKAGSAAISVSAIDSFAGNYVIVRK